MLDRGVKGARSDDGSPVNPSPLDDPAYPTNDRASDFRRGPSLWCLLSSVSLLSTADRARLGRHT